MVLDDFASDRDPHVTTSESTTSDRAQNEDAHQPLFGAVNFNAPDHPPAYVDLVAIRKPWHRRFGTFPRKNVPQIGSVFFNHVGRPARQDEAEATIEEIAQVASIKSLSQTIGFFGGLCVAIIRGPRSFPLPVPSAKTIDLDRLGPLKGSRARSAWLIIRAGSWATMGSILGFAFTLSVAAPMILWGYAQDPRLKDYHAALRQNAMARLGKRRAVESDATERVEKKFAEETDTGPGRRMGETFEMAKQRHMVSEQGQQRQRLRQDEQRPKDDNSFSKPGPVELVDDVSSKAEPFGGAFMNFEETPTEKNQQSRSVQQGQPQDRTMNAPWEFFGDQQPSPRPSTPQQSLPSSSSSSGPGSAWERLRHQAFGRDPTSNRSDNGMGAQGQVSTSSRDGYNFSQIDEERQLSQSSASREFDARIERKRQGEDLDDRGSGSGRAW